MKREIKFRGKRLDGQGWAFGSYIEAELQNGIAHEIIPYKRGEPVVEVDPDTVGQFTGVKDKNGMRIFEGDILGVGGRIIGWVQGGVRGYCYDVVYVNHPKGEERYTLYATATYDYRDRLEVVGNIYDNPDLLKTE